MILNLKTAKAQPIWKLLCSESRVDRTFVPESEVALLICSRPPPGLESSPQVIRLGADPWLLSL
jgi:hypothetical protein